MFGDLVDLIRHTFRRLTSRRPMAVEVDLSGKNAIVTGGAENSIGYQVARTLAAWGADVVVTSLGDTDALERVLREDLRSEGYEERRITARHMDLSDDGSIADFAGWYAEREKELHILVNNAGVFKDIARRVKTPICAADGVEIHWRINFLGTFHLTSLLMPLLQRAGERTGDARVVVTSSELHHRGRNDLFFAEHSGRYDSWVAYSQAKLALVHFAFEIQRRYAEDSNVQSAVLHPGSVRTNLTAAGLEGNPILKRVHRLTDPLMAPFFLNLVHGAQMTIACATAVPLQGGQFHEACAVSRASEEATDEMVAKRLWDKAEDWVAAQTRATARGRG